MHICPSCHGRRMNPDSASDLCAMCNGRGLVLVHYTVCPTCKGAGELPSGTKCAKCRRTGFLTETGSISSEPVTVEVEQIERLLGPLMDIQTGDTSIADIAPEDYQALTLVGALVSYSQERTQQGYPPGWFLGNILDEGGTLVLDVGGIWHQPKGSEHGVQIVQFPTLSYS